ncbi:MAG TPA: hypothetical protein VLO30_06390 [Chthoniobacterales bacterium]|nr:hypothetical protein [Chthoniobacterales bacterium]
MNLNLVHRLLKAADGQPYGFFKVRGAHLAREVELMASAGLVEAASTIRGLETLAVINRVTDSGHSFLRAFKDQPPSPDRARNNFAPSRSGHPIAEG